MKLFPLLTAVGVAGISFFTSPSAMAFWWVKMPTYEQLNREGYIVQSRESNLIYNSDGWITGSIDSTTGDVRKIKLVDCRMNKCIYYMRMADIREKYKRIHVMKVDCATKKNAIKTQGEWGSFLKIYDRYADYDLRAYKSFC